MRISDWSSDVCSSDLLDDQLGHGIAGRRLAAEDLHPRQPVRHRIVADLVVERDGLKEVQELALVLVDPIDLDVQQRPRIDLDPGSLPDDGGAVALVLPLYLGSPE